MSNMSKRAIYEKAVSNLLDNKITASELVDVIMEHLSMKDEEIKSINRYYEAYTHLSQSIGKTMLEHTKYLNFLKIKQHD